MENNGCHTPYYREVKPIMKFAVSYKLKNGSITVEAAIIVPIMILSIAAVIYMGLLLYQRTVIQSAVETAARDGAAAWSSGVGEMETGRVSGESFDTIRLYRRIFDDDRETRLETIENHAASLAAGRELLSPDETVVQAEMKDYAVCRKLVVNITQSYKLPLGNFLKLFGGSGMVRISVKGSSMLDEPAELIRTTDFILDLEKELEENNPDIKNLGEKTRNTMNELKSRLEKFLN